MVTDFVMHLQCSWARIFDIDRMQTYILPSLKYLVSEPQDGAWLPVLFYLLLFGITPLETKYPYSYYDVYIWALHIQLSPSFSFNGPLCTGSSEMKCVVVPISLDWSGVGLLKLRSLISPQAELSIWLKYLLDSLNHMCIWQVPPQLSCGDTC